MSLVLPLLATLPWIGVVAFAVRGIRFPAELPPARLPESGALDAGSGALEAEASALHAEWGESGGEPERLPFVSVIVPARNEEETIRTCLRHLTASRYPRFEIVVVDDRSADGTRALAEAFEPGTARRLRVVEGEPLPEGWLGKPWACWQGYRASDGELLLFTDADTRHDPDLLERAVRGMRQDGTAALSLVARQLMESFWEKVVQPHMLVLLAFRFPRIDRIMEPGRCGQALANGQFILVGRGVYEEIGGHRSVRGEVVEDLQLARRLCHGGHRLCLREAQDLFETRMYRSLRQIVEGWSKNLAIAARQTMPRAVAPVVIPAGVVVALALWILPVVVLAAAVAGWAWDGVAPGAAAASSGTGGSGGLAALGRVSPEWSLWAAVTVGLSLFFWTGVARRSRIFLLWGATYPLGVLTTCFVQLRSWIRGSSVEWKGRRYRVEADRPPEKLGSS